MVSGLFVCPSVSNAVLFCVCIRFRLPCVRKSVPLHLYEYMHTLALTSDGSSPIFESILADCQHGFRSQRSCETQLVQFYHDMVSNLDGARDRGQKQTDVIIMDFAKAK